MTSEEFAALCARNGVDPKDVRNRCRTKGNAPAVVATRLEALCACVAAGMSYGRTRALVGGTCSTIRRILTAANVPMPKPIAQRSARLPIANTGHMLPVAGERDETCVLYRDCLGACVKAHPKAPASCPAPLRAGAPSPCDYRVTENPARATDFLSVSGHARGAVCTPVDGHHDPQLFDSRVGWAR